MIHLSRETETLAHRLAEAQGVPIAVAVARAIEDSARTTGLTGVRRRQTVEEMLAVGAEIADMPVLDPRTPQQIMDDIDAE